MKKTIAFLFTGFCAAAAFAGINNLVVTFSSQGPDKYTDGTTVLDGECYALVYTPDGAEFAGISANGAAVAPSKVVIAAPVAKNGACPQIQFQIDETYRNQNYPNGTWGVYLLDTRRYKTNEQGEITTELESVGNKDQVNGYGQVAALGAGNFASAAAGAGAIANSASFASDAKVAVKNIKVDGDNVIITAEAPTGARVGIAAGATPANLNAVGGEKYGAEEVIFITPKANGNFFKVEAK